MMPRFCRYIEKVFGCSRWLAGLSDARPRPQIPASTVFSSALMMFATRRGSLNALEVALRTADRWKHVVGRRRPSADTVSRVMTQIDTECVRDVLSGINHRLKRNKVLANHWGLRFVALDGHEFFRRQASPLQSVQPAPGFGGPGEGH